MHAEFWRDAKQVRDLIKPVCDAIHQLEADRPLLSQVLRVWNDLLQHAASWGDRKDSKGKAAVTAELKEGVSASFTRRFDKHYCQPWAAAFCLDPAFASNEDGTGWQLPVYKLSARQYEDAKECITRLAGGGEAVGTAVAREMTSLKLGSLPDQMAADLSVLTSRTVKDGKVFLADTEMRRKWWRQAEQYPHVSKAAMRLLSMHVTTCASERNWSLWGRTYVKGRSKLEVEKAAKLIYVKGNSQEKGSQDEEVTLERLTDD
jgi:hypothetical protein